MHVPSLKASKQGLAKIKQARNEKGWNVDDDRWLREASKRIESTIDWDAENYADNRIFAVGVSSATWRRFREGKEAINANVFKAFCQVLELNWEEVVDRSSNSKASVSKASVRWELVWSATIDDARKPRVEAILAHLRELAQDETLTLVKIQEGSVVLVFEGSPQGFEQIKGLFKLGKLPGLLKIPILEVRGAFKQELTRLSQWFRNKFEEAWQPKEWLVATARTADAPATLGFEPIRNSISRAKMIDFGKKLDRSVILVVHLASTVTEEVDICLQLYPANNAIKLPPDLQLFVLDNSGVFVMEAKARSADDWMQLKFSGSPQECFSLRIVLGNASITEEFVI